MLLREVVASGWEMIFDELRILGLVVIEMLEIIILCFFMSHVLNSSQI